MKNKAAGLLKNYWPVIAVLLIVLLGVQVRLLDYRWPYLRNIDSYAFARQIEEVATYGHMLPYDELGLAPETVPRTLGHDWYVYFAGYSYLFFRMLTPGLTLFQFLIWFPPLLASLMAIPMYYIGKLLFDRRAGVMAAFFIVFDIAIMSRSLGGDPDSDAAVLFFPLLAIMFFLAAYKYASEARKINARNVILTALSGVFLAVWAYTWSGFWYVVWLLTGFVVLKLAAEAARVRNPVAAVRNSRRTLAVYAATILIFFLLTVPVFGASIFYATASGPFQFGEIKSEENRPFPNVYVSVAELQASGDAKSIIQRTSAVNFDQNPVVMLISPFFLMLYAILYLFYSYYRTRKHLDTLILLFIWFVGPFIATITAVRFSILFSAPIAIGSAILLSKLIRVLKDEEKLGE